MDDADDDPDATVEESREPTLSDLVELCRELNLRGAKYVVVGGFAIRNAGSWRTTMDIDLLIDAELENEARVFKALEILPDRAVLELEPGDVAKYIVCRVGDDITVDLMQSACGIDYAGAASHIVIRDVDGVGIPFASPLLLWRTKKPANREKDIADLQFLHRLFVANGIPAPE